MKLYEKQFKCSEYLFTFSDRYDRITMQAKIACIHHKDAIERKMVA